MLAEGSARSFQAQVPMELGREITLDVLRTEGLNALTTSGIEGLEAIRLAAVQVTYLNTFLDTKVYTAEDASDPSKIIPKTGILTGALLLFHFADTQHPIPVELQRPNTLIFPEDGHEKKIRRWLAASHFLGPPGDFCPGQKNAPFRQL